MRDGARLANGDLMDEGGVKHERGGGGCAGRRGGNRLYRGNTVRSWARGHREVDFRAHESYGLL